jgi:hypothetical protein
MIFEISELKTWLWAAKMMILMNMFIKGNLRVSQTMIKLTCGIVDRRARAHKRNFCMASFFTGGRFHRGASIDG